ncbi:MAG TPA: hypothetical protein VM032_03730, partial [Vicinamibacterales bacterium]|nr:hypothetical protein [Vicinamibacterales bacterium]
AVGKKLQLARYESNLGWRIREGLEARRGPEMRTLARIGSLVFHDPDSATLLKEIDERSALMARARQLYVQLPDGSVGQMDMLAALCDLDFDRAFCRREVGRLDSFVSDRRGALERLYAAVIERADEAVRSQLDTTCGSAGSIGFCASLLNDLRSTAGRRPYLEALQRAGAKNFIAQAMAATDLRLATLKTMATGVAAGGEPRDD